MQLSEHFSLEEFTDSAVALRRGIDNQPEGEEMINMRTISAPKMEQVRLLLGGQPIYISSGYRSPALNYAIGGSQTSAHVHGLAVDFTCPAYGTPREIAQCIADSGIDYDQIIHEGTWVHIGFARNPRRQIMTARFTHGHVTYTGGIS